MVKGKFTRLSSATFVQVILGAGLPSAKHIKLTSSPLFTTCSPEIFVILDASLKGTNHKKSHKIVRGFISNTNSDKMLSDFGGSNVKICQLRSQVQSNDQNAINYPQTYTAHQWLLSLFHCHTHYWLHTCIHQLDSY